MSVHILGQPLSPSTHGTFFILSIVAPSPRNTSSPPPPTGSTLCESDCSRDLREAGWWDICPFVILAYFI